MFPNNYVVDCDPPKDDDEPSKPSLPRRTRKFDRKELDRKLESMETKESSKEDETASLISRSGRNNSHTGAYEFILEDSERESRTSGQQFWDALNLFGCCGEEREHKKPSNAKPLRFTLWAHNMGNYAALFLVVGGVFAEYWADDSSDPKAQKHANTGLGAYSILAGLIAAIFEYTCGLKRPLGVYEQNGFPARSVLQIILAIPAYFTVPTILGAAMLSASAAANFAANVTNEYGDQSGKANKRRKKARKKAGDDDPFGLLEDIGKEGCCERVKHVIGRLRESDYLGQAVLSIVYVVWCSSAKRENLSLILTHSTHEVEYEYFTRTPMPIVTCSWNITRMHTRTFSNINTRTPRARTQVLVHQRFTFRDLLCCESRG